MLHPKWPNFFQQNLYQPSFSRKTCKIQCTIYCHRVVKIIAPFFCICWTPTLRLKMTATDPAFRWCRLLVVVLWFSQRKCGVCPKKVGKMAFFGCSDLQWTKFTWKLLLELKRYQSKVKVFWNAWAVGFQIVKLKNQRMCARAYLKYAGTHILKFKITKFSLIMFEKKMCFTFSRFLRKKQTFQKVPCFTVKCLIWLILDLT